MRRYSANCPPTAAAAAAAAAAMATGAIPVLSVVDSFSCGRRASMAVPTERDRLSLMNVLDMRRRLSYQVRHEGEKKKYIRIRAASGDVGFH